MLFVAGMVGTVSEEVQCELCVGGAMQVVLSGCLDFGLPSSRGLGLWDYFCFPTASWKKCFSFNKALETISLRASSIFTFPMPFSLPSSPSFQVSALRLEMEGTKRAGAVPGMAGGASEVMGAGSWKGNGSHAAEPAGGHFLLAALQPLHASGWES